jgi:hypothetical protein
MTFYCFKNDEKLKERTRKLDFDKLNYVTTNYSENQQLQYYFSMELPELMRVKIKLIKIIIFDLNKITCFCFDSFKMVMLIYS